MLRASFDAHSDRIELLSESVVWGVFEGRRLALTGADAFQVIDAECVVLAPGAYEYVPPFPGWTLPGVLTPGGAQILAKTYKVRPGRRALVAGTGPFLLVAANHLLAMEQSLPATAQGQLF